MSNVSKDILFSKIKILLFNVEAVFSENVVMFCFRHGV